MSKGSQQLAERISAQIAGQLESADPEAFEMPWHRFSGMPRNAKSGRAYQGINFFLLFDAPWWATYKQWGELGRQVRKGEKATAGTFWGRMEREGEPVLDDKGRQISFQRLFQVFSFEQTEPAEGAEKSWVPPAAQEQLGEAERIARAEEAIEKLRADIAFGFDRASYTPAADLILMPAMEAFFATRAGMSATEAFYATLLHELGHWTGHEKRLGRQLENKRGSDAYAFEELIAELTAAICCASFEISPEPRPDHAQYLAGWIRILRADPQAFGKAASAAQKAASWIIEGGPAEAAKSEEDAA